MPTRIIGTNAQMQHLKAKILRIKSAHYKSMQLDVGANDEYRDEQPSLYQLIKTRKRQRQRTITSLLNADRSM
jgi:beta-lactamase superfamily II metal-dependent hydrolase